MEESETEIGMEIPNPLIHFPINVTASSKKGQHQESGTTYRPPALVVRAPVLELLRATSQDLHWQGFWDWEQDRELKLILT